MPATKPSLARLALLATAAAYASCTSWQTTRTDLVEPIQKLLHQDYPKALRAQDPDAIARLHQSGLTASAHARATAMLSPWQSVTHATCVLDSVTLEGDELIVDATVRVDGVRKPIGQATGLRAPHEASAGALQAGQRATSVETQRLVCVRDPEADGAWRIASCERRGQTTVVTEPAPRFVDEADQRGLHFRAVSDGVADRCGVVQDYLPGSGLAVGDLDDDGMDDLVLVRGRAVRTFFQHSDGRFVDGSEAHGFGGAVASGEHRFALIGDLDADGDRDVYVGRMDAPDIAFFNRGDGTFERCLDLATRCGIESTGESMGACLLDLEGDGDLDLFIAGGANLLELDPDPVYGAENAAPNRLFRNDGHGHFEDISSRAGIDDTGWALACTTGDVDLDGDTDIYVANDFGPDRLYQNDGTGVFTDVAADTGITWRGSTMGVSMGDIDADGDIDIFATGMASNSAWLVDQPGFPAPASWLVRTLFRPYVLDVMREMFWGNRLYLNRGDGTFEEASSAAQTRNSGWAWGGVLLDYDHDSHLDVYVPNGLWSGEVKDDL